MKPFIIILNTPLIHDKNLLDMRTSRTEFAYFMTWVTKSNIVIIHCGHFLAFWRVWKDLPPTIPKPQHLSLHLVFVSCGKQNKIFWTCRQYLADIQNPSIAFVYSDNTYSGQFLHWYGISFTFYFCLLVASARLRCREGITPRPQRDRQSERKRRQEEGNEGRGKEREMSKQILKHPP